MNIQNMSINIIVREALKPLKPSNMNHLDYISLIRTDSVEALNELLSIQWYSENDITKVVDEYKRLEKNQA